MSGVKGRSGPPGNENGATHGVITLERKRKQGQIDRRTRPYRAVSKRQRDIEADYLKKRKQWHANNAARGEYYCERIDAYLLALKHLVRKGKINPAVETWLHIAESVDRDYSAYEALISKGTGHPDLARRIMEDLRARGSVRDAAENKRDGAENER